MEGREVNKVKATIVLCLVFELIVLLPHYCPARSNGANNSKTPIITSISPTTAQSGSTTVVLTGDNFNRTNSVAVCDASSGTQLATASYAVNSPTQLSAMVNLQAGSYEFRVRAITGTSNLSPALTVTAPQPAPAPAPAPDPAPAPSGNYFNFDPTTKSLTIDTQMMQLGFEGGAIVYVKDKTSNEVIVPYAAPSNPVSGCLGYGAGWKSGGGAGDRVPLSSSGTFTKISSTHGRVNYSNDTGSNGCTFQYDFTVDAATGEVVITSTCTEADPNKWAAQANMSIMNYVGSNGCLLSNGKIYNRTDANINDLVWGRWPQVAVAQGSNAAVGLWSENTEDRDGWFGVYMDVAQIYHVQGFDHLIFTIPNTNTAHAALSSTVTGGPWRIGTYPNWCEVARRWRQRFEALTGAVPLWNFPTTWVRNIHCMYDYLTRQSGDLNRYQNIAELVDNSAKMLFYAWNGNGSSVDNTGPTDFILFGDHRFSVSPSITDEEITLIKQSIPRVILYLPWTMIFNQTGAETRVNTLKGSGEAPSDYVFEPDWNGGSLTNWYNTWPPYSTANTNYDPVNRLILHPGSDQFRDYMNTYAAAYCTAHNCDGTYQDVMGVVEWSKDMNGRSYCAGERDAVNMLAQNQPDLTWMSENLAIDLRIPFTYWGRDGSHYTTFTHPFYAALIGSYLWQSDMSLQNFTTKSNYADQQLRLIYGAGLPQVARTGDYLITNEIATWCQDRATLYCTYDMFHDLPPANPGWVNHGSYKTLAYFRTNQPWMIRYEDRGGGNYAYVRDDNNTDLLTFP